MIKAVIFDLDGTLYVGNTPIPGAAETLERLRSKGMKVLFLTNAATKRRAEVALKLTNMGLKARKEEIYCGAYVLARYISQNHKGKKVYVVGEKGILEEFKEVGIQVSEEAEIVAVGLDRLFTYEKLAKAHMLLTKGALFFASNKDQTYPSEQGDLPGSGAIVTAIEYSSEKKPYIVGKPNPYVLDLIKMEHKLKNEEIMMVGDRLDTDITFAKNCKIKSALVLTGIAKKSEIKDIVPDYVFDSVGKFTLPSNL